MGNTRKIRRAQKAHQKQAAAPATATLAQPLPPDQLAKLPKLDLGCGSKKKGPEWTGVDILKMDGVDVVFDLRTKPWPFADNSFGEGNCTHFIEHLTNLDDRWERIIFFNELHRVLAPGAKVWIAMPHWCSNRYYGDPTHKEPFSEMGFLYLLREWRLREAPHVDVKFNPNGYTCDFDFQNGWAFHRELWVRNDAYKQFAVQWFKEAADDLLCTITKRP